MPRSAWFLISAMFINAVGNSFIWPLNSIYVHHNLEKSLTIAGLVLMLNSLAGVFGNLLGGFLYDRIGGYKSVALGGILNLLAVIGLVIWHDWPHYVWFLMGLGFSGGIVFPSIYALMGNVWPGGGLKSFNALFLASNVGVAIGPAIAGFIADVSFDYVFISNFFVYLVFLLFVLITFRNFQQTTVKKKKKVDAEKDHSVLSAILILSIAVLICWAGYSQWMATISNYTQELGISLSKYSLLWTINGVLIVGIQPFIRPLLNYWSTKYKHQLITGLLIMSISFIVAYFAEDFKMFAAAMVLLTIGEVLFTPVLPTIANLLAPSGSEGFYQGIVNSVATAGRMLGPLVGGIVVDTYGIQLLMILVAIAFVIAVIPCLIYDYKLKQL